MTDTPTEAELNALDITDAEAAESLGEADASCTRPDRSAARGSAQYVTVAPTTTATAAAASF